MTSPLRIVAPEARDRDDEPTPLQPQRLRIDSQRAVDLRDVLVVRTEGVCDVDDEPIRRQPDAVRVGCGDAGSRQEGGQQDEGAPLDDAPPGDNCGYTGGS
jgi:hypothetical protein